MAETAKSPVIVSGYGQSEFGIFITVKDKVSLNKMLKAKANKHGLINVEKGFTLDEVKAAYPFGKAIEGAEWGAQVPTNAEGEELQNVYTVEVI
jgi:hypothetical protein